MKIVLDTNCLVNVIMPGSYNNDVWQAFRAGKYILCVTNEILFEYHEILTKRYNNIIANTVLKAEVEVSNTEDFAKSATVSTTMNDTTNVFSVSPTELEDAWFNNITKNPSTTKMYYRTILYTVTKDDAAARRKGLVQGKMRGRVTGGLPLPFHGFPVQIKDNHVIRAHALIGNPGRLDDDQAGFPVDARNIAPGKRNKVILRQKQVCFTYSLFERFQHHSTSGASISSGIAFR